MKTVERKSECRDNHQFAALVHDLTIQWISPVWNQNFTGDGEEFHGSFQGRRRSQKLFKWTIIRIWQNIVKNYHGIIDSYISSITDKKLQNELYVE